MKPRILLDENVSLALASRLRSLGHEVEAVAEQPTRGMNDQAVLNLATTLHALLITRDAHFTNPIRFDPSGTAGILHIVHGNLSAEDEGNLVTKFLEATDSGEHDGKLVLLSRSGAVIR